MYGFIDVTDYQKVVVTDVSKGIKEASQNYLNQYADEISEDLLIQEKIKVEKVSTANINGNTYYYVTANNKKYKLSIELSDELPFIGVGDTLNVGYYESNKKIIDVVKLINE